DQFKTLKKLKKPSVTVIDTNGKKLKAGTDYTVGEMDTSIPGNTDESGQVFIILTGKGNYSSDDPAKTSFRYMAASANMSRTKTMRSISARGYTGSAVYLRSKDLSEILYTGSKSAPEYLVYGKDFAVSGYKNNKKKGTAKVTLKGLGSFAGTKTLTFRITEKKGDYKGVLIGGQWQ
ncbi:MAG: hypothetical protein J5966_08345, partial [Lachnospiraceae bacterium]|nr:hypothetical protein [Lachnospiraceae bacterium]